MPTYDLLIRNGALVTESGVATADIACVEGRIVAIGPTLEGTAGRELDAAGLHVFPGLIDAHVHFNEPGRAEWEGFATGTRALAAGGATTFCDMPLNAHPPTLDADSFDRKLAAARAAALVDFALWGGLTPQNVARLPELAERGVVGFKAFMSNSGIDDFAAADDLTLFAGMRIAAQLGLPVTVHAESDAITTRMAARALAEGRVSARDYARSRPVVAEVEAIARAITLASEAGCALHVVHVSSGRGVRLVAEARLRGVDVSCETCPHYLTLTEDDLDALGAVAKCAPPLRDQSEQDALWRALADGSLPMVASDHSPSPPGMKEGNNFFQIWGGISGCQSTLPLLLSDGHARRGLPLPLIASVTASFVARRFRLPGKGVLAVGYDADIALVDLSGSAELRADDLHYRHRQSPYVGRMLQGRVESTVVRGATVYERGRFAGEPAGRLVKPGPPLPVQKLCIC